MEVTSKLSDGPYRTNDPNAPQPVDYKPPRYRQWVEDPTEAEMKLYDEVIVAYIRTGLADRDKRAKYADHMANEVVTLRRNRLGRK